MRGSVGGSVADQLHQTPSAIGEAVMESLMAFLRANSRTSRKAVRLTGQGVMVAGAVLARARRNRAAKNAEEGNRVVHPTNRTPANNRDVRIARTARDHAGDRELTGRVKAAIAANPDTPDDVRRGIAGPGGDGAVDRVLASIEHTDVAAALALPKRQDELIDRVSREWTETLGFDGDFADAWRHAAANPDIAARSGVDAGEPAQGSWARFAAWDPATPPGDEERAMLNGAWLSAIASLERESADVRRAIEGLLARWEPLVYESYRRNVIGQALAVDHHDLQSGELDRISAVEAAMVHADDPARGHEDGRPLTLPEAWERVLENPQALRDRDDRQIRDLVESWSFNALRGQERAMRYADEAEEALNSFGEHLAAANPELDEEYRRRLEQGEHPVPAYTAISRASTGHPFDPGSRLVVADGDTGGGEEPPVRSQQDERAREGAVVLAADTTAAAHPASGLVEAVEAGELPGHRDFTTADFAQEGALDPPAGLATLGGKYRANRRANEQTKERTGSRSM
ncbi:hypothetical protein FZ103_17365 [Streptomonospora sp. PA3]|uniref:hypothetical protein n=1 Tax=Streptomonospora sp. PA3 TaxID=2607326 RepID=UPI0012DFB7A1|nr:hypothetical protein [Streptomonospora sp. PA3]MUL42916.1 hypothetical protein [Streptomonospora sp. PA3]